MKGRSKSSRIKHRVRTFASTFRSIRAKPEPTRGRSRRGALLFAASLAIAALAGCEVTPERAPPAPAPASEELLPLLRYADRVETLNAEQLAVEYLDIKASLSPSAPDPAQSIKLALLVSAERAPFRSSAEAIKVLQSYLGSTADRHAPLPQLASLIVALLNHELVERASHAKTRNALAGELERRAALEGQIEALKDIERSLSSPPAATPPPTP
jgi:hypothetical protein